MEREEENHDEYNEKVTSIEMKPWSVNSERGRKKKEKERKRKKKREKRKKNERKK